MNTLLLETTAAPLRVSRGKRAGFTLIETALAVGIVAFALIPVVGLLPFGLQASRTASDLTITTQIAQRLSGMIQQTDEPSAKSQDGSSSLMQNYYYFDGEGQPLGSAQQANGVYAAGIIAGPTSDTLVDPARATSLTIQIVNDSAHVVKGKPSTAQVPVALRSRVTLIPVYMANN